MFRDELREIKCDGCLNGRPVLSENGWHIACCLSYTAMEDCYLGIKDRKVTVRKGNNNDNERS